MLELDPNIISAVMIATSSLGLLASSVLLWRLRNLRHFQRSAVNSVTRIREQDARIKSLELAVEELTAHTASNARKLRDSTDKLYAPDAEVTKLTASEVRAKLAKHREDIAAQVAEKKRQAAAAQLLQDPNLIYPASQIAQAANVNPYPPPPMAVNQVPYGGYATTHIPPPPTQNEHGQYILPVAQAAGYAMVNQVHFDDADMANVATTKSKP